MLKLVLCLGGWISVMATALAADAPSRAAIEQFERQVRPIFVEHCSACHGAKKQEGALRVDSRAALLKGGDNGPVVEPGKPESSRLIEAVQRRGELKMPPDTPLSKMQVDALTEWVKLGAVWPVENPQTSPSKAELAKSHWAFQPVSNPPLPSVKQTAWVKNSIDHFVLAKLEAAGVQPAPRASQRTLIRRASIDLLGLPPDPEAVTAFEADERDAATQQLIDRYLQSPHYGERWGRYWLDIARYADTKGYVFFEDKNYPWSYAYRDYVIRAFNEDLPFQRFILEQLAADQLDLGDDKRPLAAMGFLTLGSHFMGNVHDQIDDRIDVLSRGLLGLTVGCARCHDHKYDPITQADYYALYGVFRSSVEPTVPPAFLPTPDTEEARKFDAELKTRLQKLDAFISKKRDEISKGARERVAEYLQAIHVRRFQPSTENFMLIANPGALNPAVITRWEVALRDAKQRQDAVWLIWNRLSELTDDEFPTKAPAVLSELLRPTNAESAPKINALVRAAFLDFTPSTMKEVAERYGTTLLKQNTEWSALVEAATKAGQAAPARLMDDAAEELRLVFYGPRAAPMIPQALGWGFLDLIPDRAAQGEYKKLLGDVENWSKTGPSAPPRAGVMMDAETLYDPVIFLRGNPHRQGAAVARQFLSVLNRSQRPFVKGSGRLELAQAIASDQNPLTARVIVNRVWQYHFGEGLVRTPSDFGVRGDPPTSHELLDHLATTFMRGGWSIKSLHRLIMNSATYQQASVVDRSAIKPPESGVISDYRGFTPFPRRRLDFEGLRDAMLVVSGSLNPQIGGPSIDVVNGFNPRRSCYGFIERLDLPALMRTFDFPDPAASSGQRSETTVAPQALFLMNHDFIGQCAARALQRPDVKSLSDPTARLRRLYAIAYGRQPNATEEQVALNFLTPPTPESPAVSAWRYGYGRVAAEPQRTADFVELKHWTGTRWQVGPTLPDPKLGWVFIDARGGHPAEHEDRCSIRRWVAPIAGKVQVTGAIAHVPAPGNGVRGRLISSRAGQVGEWKVHKSRSDIGSISVDVQPGDTLDFVVDFAGEILHDEYEWPVEIRLIDPTAQASTVWNSEKEFRGEHKTVDVWHSFLHALLMTNEFVFVD